MPKHKHKHCQYHGKTRHVSEKSKSGGGVYYRCSICKKDRKANYLERKKIRLVEMFGGECSRCGYNRYLGALQFHHVDPSTKEFTLRRGNCGRKFELLIEEANKCVVLCANCHAEHHGGIDIGIDIPRR